MGQGAKNADAAGDVLIHMSDNQKNFEIFVEQYSKEIVILDRMLLNVHSVSNIRYLYNYLMNLELDEFSHEFIMRNEALTTGLIIGYGRLFTQGDNATRLSRRSIPENLRSVHDQIIDLRNQRYAHHGNHETVKTTIEIISDGSSITVTPQITFGFWVGASKSWKPLFEWLDGYMYETIFKQLNNLSQLSGVPWSMSEGEPPPWVKDSLSG